MYNMCGAIQSIRSVRETDSMLCEHDKHDHVFV